MGCRTVCRLGGILAFRLRAWGVGNVPREGGLVLAANHASFLDPPAVGTTLPREVHFLARRSLFDVPLLGPLIARLHALPVERGEADLGAMRRAVRVLRGGGALLLFPEGTRSPDGAVRDFKSGFALLAARAGAPVVPVAVAGTFAAWPRQRRLPRLGAPVAVAYGEPMAPPAGNKAACVAAAAAVRQRVVAMREGLKEKVL